MLGFIDGGHWIPIGGKLWNTNFLLFNFIHGIISSTFVFSFLYLIIYLCQFNFYNFMLYNKM